MICTKLSPHHLSTDMETNLQREWRETNVRVDHNEEMLESIRRGRRKSALQRLAARYRMFSIIGAVCTVTMPWLLSRPEMIPDSPLKMWMLIFFALYFLTCFAMDMWLYHGISGIDTATMSVSEVISRALFYKKRHLQFVLILLPWAFVIVGCLIYSAGVDAAIYGMIAGGSFGLIIGINQLRRFLSDYRDITGV